MSDRNIEILDAIAKADAFSEVFWKVENEQVHFFVNCNDLFYWGASDAEEITRSNLHIFEQSYKDSPINGGSLFCCRVGKMRPQGAFYKYLKDNEKPFFDACGPEREVDIGNPEPQC